MSNLEAKLVEQSAGSVKSISRKLDGDRGLMLYTQIKVDSGFMSYLFLLLPSLHLLFTCLVLSFFFFFPSVFAFAFILVFSLVPSFYHSPSNETKQTEATKKPTP